MVKIKSLEELKRIKEQAQNSVSLRVKGDNIENMIQIRRYKVRDAADRQPLRLRG